MGIVKKIVFGDPSFTESQEKKRKLFMYLVSGGLTTVANWIVYILFDLLVKSDMSLSVFGFEFSLKIAVKQIVGWIVAVIVAYFLNRITVFRSKGSILRELLAFAGARVLSFVVLELGVMYLMVWICELITKVPVETPMTYIGSFAFTYDYLVKLINCVFVVIANYVLSKLMVFKKKDMVDYNAQPAQKSEEASSGKEAADA
ncbi:GtrA family protein [Butyrivibrio sp. AE2032]|uniref:GtrA family protein n=1 Tax=Butyrivibrio sp. AE2032 TaxID=1458463 RepID=UPI000557C99B|nr:GtrA family protein [Butyrivibrio sp. AE2032]